jgi:hypothetical protein
MPAWLLQLITGILEPIILSVIDKIGLSVRISKLEDQSQGLRDSFTKIAEAKSAKDYQDAAHDLASRWNSPK